MVEGSEAISTRDIRLFGGLTRVAADPLLALIAMHAADPRPERIDLGVGVFRDAEGRTPVFAAIKAAEAKLLADQPTKAYLGTAGDLGFLERLAPIALGSAAGSNRVVGVQTPGGSGALRLASEVAARARPGTRIWVGTPTWPNHVPIFEQAELEVVAFPLVDIATQTLDAQALIDAVGRARPGDLVLLHGCCHNPTGLDLTPADWQALVPVLAQRGVIPLIDLAYQGLGLGLDTDRAGLELCLAQLPEVLVAYSCDKNFGLYRERSGALWACAASQGEAQVLLANLLALARINWSMPPDHGAAAVRLVLEDAALTQDWQRELDAMRIRIDGLRRALAACHPALAPLAKGAGMFATLPLSGAAVEALRRDEAIYMAPSGRINVAGLNEGNLERFAGAVAPYLPQ